MKSAISKHRLQGIALEKTMDTSINKEDKLKLKMRLGSTF